MPDSSFLRRLKERKLAQWALAYVAGAFVVFQLLDALAEPLALSVTTQQAILTLVAIGFFVTLVLAWYHGEKGQQRASGPELLMVAALLVVAGVAVEALLTDEDAQPARTAVPSVPEASERPAIAVLPFDNLSPDPENEFFADGIHEEILAHLSQIGGLKVISRTSVMAYRDRQANLRTVAEELNVTNILEGTVRRQQDRVRVTAQLIDALSDEHVWTEVYDRNLTDVFAVQSDVARNVAIALRATLTAAELERIEDRPTDNLEAYDHYLRGRQFWHQRSVAAFDSAIKHLNQAILLEPRYARAYAALAETYVLLPEYGGPSIPEILPLARAATERALTLDPDLAEAYSASGYLKAVFEWDWDAAERDYLRALERNPDYATAHQWYGELLGTCRRWDEALAEAQRAVDVDPLSPAASGVLGVLLAYAGRPDEAIPMFERALRAVADWLPAVGDLAFAYVLAGDYATAAPVLDRLAELTRTDPDSYRAFLDALSDPARMPAAVAVLRAGEAYSTISAADYLAHLGQLDEALAILAEDYERRNPRLPWVNAHPAYERFRSDPRFQGLLRRMNLPCSE